MSKEIKNIVIVSDIKTLIEQSRSHVALAVNAEITLLYWKVGKRINDEVLGNERAEYGKQIIQSLSTQLAREYGKGWGEKQLRQCMQFAAVFEDEQIVYALRRQLSWTHLRSIIYMEDPLKRAFYIEMCKLEKWSSRQLQERIQSMLYERTAISKKPELTIQHDLELLKHEQVEGEKTPIGLILCTGKNEEHVELMQLDKSNIRVADYLTALPSQKVLQEKLHRAVEIARQKLNAKNDE